MTAVLPYPTTTHEAGHEKTISPPPSSTTWLPTIVFTTTCTERSRTAELWQSPAKPITARSIDRIGTALPEARVDSFYLLPTILISFMPVRCTAPLRATTFALGRRRTSRHGRSVCSI